MRAPLAICIPTYARARTLERLLGHIEGEAPDVPVLVSDNASPDGTAVVLARAARPALHVHRHAGNLGAIANIRWLLAHAPEAEHVWMICDDDVPAPGSITAIRELVAHEQPAWLHLPHRWVDAAGSVVNRSPCPPSLERYAGTGDLYRAYGHWLTFGSAAVIRRDELARAATEVETVNAYAPLVWFAHAAAGGPCIVAPFVAVDAGTEITWADRLDSIVSADYPALYEDVLHRYVDETAFAASLDLLYGSDWGAGIWRSPTRDHLADVLRRFPASRVLRRIAAERSAREGDAGLRELVAASIGEDERAAAAALRLEGESAFSRGDAPAALGLLEQAILGDPLDVESWSDLAVVRHALGRQGAAIEACTIALGIEPAHEDARANLEAIGA